MAGSLGDIHAHHTESFVALFLTMCYGLAVVGETSPLHSSSGGIVRNRET